MRVLNVHERVLQAPAEAVGQLLDGLASENDALWPHDRWPRMRFDGPLRVGAAGGHGPVRYVVDEYVAGRRVVFRFTAPAGFVGTHGFDVRRQDQSTCLRHSLEMNTKGSAVVSWPLIFRWLHEALIEDSLDRAQQALCEEPEEPARWSLYVRLLRGAFRRRRARRSE